MTRDEAKEKYLEDKVFLYGYYDDVNDDIEAAVACVIDGIYDKLDRRNCKNCSNLCSDTIDVFDEELPTWAIGRCTIVGHLYRKAVTPDFGCNLFKNKE